MNEKWCEWHTIVVDADGEFAEDPMTTVMHPDCAFSVHVGFADNYPFKDFQYACQIQHEIDNAGFDTLLEGIDRDRSGWYRARMRHYTTRSLEWSEIDTEYEVEELKPT